MKKDFYKINSEAFGFLLGTTKVFGYDTILPLFVTVTKNSRWHSGNPTTTAIVNGTSLHNKLYYDFNAESKVILEEHFGGKDLFYEVFTIEEQDLIEKLYYTINNPPETVLTMDQIAKKFGVAVENLRIKKQ